MTFRLSDKPYLWVLPIAIAFGLIVAYSGTLPGTLADMPLAAVVASLTIAALSPLALKNWRAIFILFAFWLMIEDLVRKMSGNDLRVYFVKDLIFIVLCMGLITGRQPGQRKLNLGASGGLLALLFTWGLIMSIPSGFEDWRTPLIGLRMNFFYLPLLLVGFHLVPTRAQLERWLTYLAGLGCVFCALGIVQSALGPGFLSPDEPTLGLPNLVLVRSIANSGPIYRPTGSFVDPSRFASAAFITLAVSLSLTYLTRGPRRAISLGFTAIAMVAIWVSAGRAYFVASISILPLALVISYVDQRKVRLRKVRVRKDGVRRTVVGIAVVFVAFLIAVAWLPDLVAGRRVWYQASLDPRSNLNEWSFRFGGYSGDTLRGLELGGILGQGTGKESLGLQYTRGGSARSTQGLYQVEGGFASVSVEWGLIGLLLWLGWSISWTVMLYRKVATSHSNSGPAMAILFSWLALTLFVFFFSGVQTFQNYITNAYFWLLSGVILGNGQRSAKDGPDSDESLNRLVPADLRSFSNQTQSPQTNLTTERNLNLRVGTSKRTGE